MPGVRQTDAGVVLTSSGVAQTVVSEIPDSGVSRWTFDDADTSGSTATDVWGGNDGAINGASTGAAGANQTYTTNEAYSFDGTDDYVSINGTDLTDGFSIATWVNVNSNTSDFGRAFSTRPDSDLEGIEFAINTSGSEWRANIEDSGGTSNRVTGPLNYDTWVHLIAAFDGSTMEFYIDGSSQGTVSSGSASTGADWFIGSRDADSSHIQAVIDDPRFYSKRLSSTEASNLYNTGSISG